LEDLADVIPHRWARPQIMMFGQLGIKPLDFLFRDDARRHCGTGGFR
jgi:hypothetical protein